MIVIVERYCLPLTNRDDKKVPSEWNEQSGTSDVESRDTLRTIIVVPRLTFRTPTRSYLILIATFTVFTAI